MTRSLFVLGLMLLLGACQGPAQENVQGAADADTVSDAEQRPAVDPGPAPGTARVRATVQDCQPHDATGYRCRIDIREVIAYGSATPVLEIGEDVNVRVAEDVVDAQEDGERWREGAEVEVTLLHEEQPTAEETSGATWRLDTVHDK